MEKSLKLLKKGFESSSGVTPEFQAFARTFKKELTALITSLGGTDIQFGKGHFECSVFFTVAGQPWNLHTGDVRDGTRSFAYMRTVKDYKDYTGGQNMLLGWNSFASGVSHIVNAVRDRQSALEKEHGPQR